MQQGNLIFNIVQLLQLRQPLQPLQTAQPLALALLPLALPILPIQQLKKASNINQSILFRQHLKPMICKYIIKYYQCLVNVTSDIVIFLQGYIPDYWQGQVHFQEAFQLAGCQRVESAAVVSC